MRRTAALRALTLSLLMVGVLPAVALAGSERVDRALSNGTHISGTTYTQNTTWTTAGSPYILDGSVVVAAGATLTIDPGVVVKLNGTFRELTINGTLSAVGSPGNEIVFSSFKDDTVGGDSNGDGVASSPAAGDWYHVRITGGTASELRYVNVRYGGWGSSDSLYGAIDIDGIDTTVAIANATITKSQRSGIYVYRGRVTLQSSTIAQNAYGISVNAGSVSIDRTTVTGNSGRGISFNLPTWLTPLPPASEITNSDVKKNSGLGIYIGANGDYPLARMPHGNWNNIFENNGGGVQIDVVGYPSFRNALVDWKQNYWGDGVVFATNQPGCSSITPNAEGGLVYALSASDPKAGPLDNGLYYLLTGTAIKCAYDPFKVGPDEFSPTYLPTAGRLALGATELAFAPELRYDAFETYRADAASILTDNYTSTYSNLVWTNTYGYLAASDPSYLSDDLTLDYLGSTYPSSLPGVQTATSEDYVDEVNNYFEDAQRLHLMPQYANRTYARYVDLVDGGVIIQYWFFYYYNPKDYAGFGVHEGDWEMIQVHLDPTGAPIEAAYSQHSAGERCDWIRVPRTPDGRPVVYVAEGSHANYFSSGYHFEWGDSDTAGGDGEWVSPAPTDVTSGPGWLAWPGKWGGSGSSPDGPAWKGEQWSDPIAWQNGVQSCTEEQTFPFRVIDGAAPIAPSSVGPEAARAPIPLPDVTARRSGKRVIVRYAFGKPLPTGANRPSVLLTAVKARGKRYVPLTKRTRITSASGQVVQPLGLGEGHRLLVAVVARDGRRSGIIVKSIR